MSVEDKIRRAEEIYNRRRENEERITNARVNVGNNIENTLVNKRLKKMITQIILCMTIYFVFYYIINNNNVFSEDIKIKCKEILSYDISFSEIYQKIAIEITTIKEKYQQMVKNPEQTENEEEDVKEEQINNEGIEESNQQIENQNIEDNKEVNEEIETKANQDENIGGPIEEIVNEEEKELTEEEQMAKDAQEIKEKISFIKPVNGITTSNFGWRNPTVSTVSKYHTGIDIGVPEGTIFVAAMEGTVELVSSVGDYRKSHKNNKWGCNDFICTL